MNTKRNATKSSRRTLHVAVTAAVLGVAAMFTAAFTFAGNDSQANDTTQVVAVAAQR
ncbi:MAG: hypothetical protein KJO02_08575 [Erythrobacter sp.]|nr:hypothetical protein [Erythrobacter sp.]NNC52399.1 hypothetical protein [Erythrobacter sp.]